jgi:hypothetical protein
MMAQWQGVASQRANLDRALAELLMQAHLRSLAAELRFAPARIPAPNLQSLFRSQDATSAAD